MGRPRGLHYPTTKRNNPDRRKIMERPPNLNHLSEEEKKVHKTKTAAEYYIKLKDEEERLAPYREGIEKLSTKRERDEFRKMINKRNKERLETIFNDSELMWRVFADREDISTIELLMYREKEKEKKMYVTDKEVDEAMNRIYGGYKSKADDDEEKEEDKPYQNPYEL